MTHTINRDIWLVFWWVQWGQETYRGPRGSMVGVRGHGAIGSVWWVSWWFMMHICLRTKHPDFHCGRAGQLEALQEVLVDLRINWLHLTDLTLVVVEYINTYLMMIDDDSIVFLAFVVIIQSTGSAVILYFLYFSQGVQLTTWLMAALYQTAHYPVKPPRLILNSWMTSRVMKHSSTSVFHTESELLKQIWWSQHSVASSQRWYWNHWYDMWYRQDHLRWI